MSLASVIAIGLGLALSVYAILAGADFGAGVLELTFRESPAPRAALARAIGPLWEANHVWLIFSITILFSAFPAAFAVVGTVLLAPFTLALMAVVVRGAAFAVRAEAARGDGTRTRWLGRAFGVASVAAPFLFGASAAGVAQVSTGGGAATPGSVPWTGLFAGLAGLLAVAMCAHLAATFMAARLARTGDLPLTGRFRRRGLQTGTALFVLGLLALAGAAWKAPALWHRLTTTALPLVVVALLAILASLLALARRRYPLGRSATVLGAGAILWGWLIAQSPRLIGSRLTIHTAAATNPALVALAIAIGVVVITVVPAFFLLHALFRPQPPEVSG